MRSPRLTAALALAGAAVAVLVMALWGYHQATAPFPGFGSASGTSPTPDPACTASPGQRYLTRHEVTVSVYNTGSRAGRARFTMTLLENAGFMPGEVGNSPDNTKVPRAEVRAADPKDPAATLVARALGPHTEIVGETSDYGPGIDVFIGDRFGGLNPKAIRRIAITGATPVC